MESEPTFSKGKIPSIGRSEEDRTHEAASLRTGRATHYLLSYSGPSFITDTLVAAMADFVGSVLGRVGPVSEYFGRVK